MVTVICKASFAIAVDGDMPLVAPEPIQRTDSNGAGPLSSTRRANEVSPRLPAVDVVMTGHGHPSAGATTQSIVRLTIQDGEQILLDRTAYIVAKRDRVTGLAGPLRPVSLGYERAYGGIGCPENPLGVGFGANANETPTLLDPVEPERVASFAAVPTLFPARKQLLRGLPRSALQQPVVEFPDAFEWRYFQAAPPSQQLVALRGGEWLSLEGVFPSQTLVQTRLPNLSAVAQVHSFFHRHVDLPQQLNLHIDMLQIDSDEQRCHVVWRGHFPLHDPAAVGHLMVVAGLESEAEPILWPAREELEFTEPVGAPGAFPIPLPLGAEHLPFPVPLPRGPLPPAPEPAELFLETVALDNDRAANYASAAGPFALPSPTASAAKKPPNIPGAPWSKPSPPAAEITGSQLTTVNLKANDPRLEEVEQQRRKAEEARREEARREEAAERALKAEEAAARERTELEAQNAATQRARVEAELRREEEAATFKLEQLEAKRAEELRAQAKLVDKRELTSQVKRNLYGGFKKK